MMSFNGDDNDDAFICDNEKFEKLRIGRLRTDRETIQEKTYKNWINSVLIKARTSIDNIYTGLADGQKLLLLLELITGEKIAEPNRGSSVLHKIENVSLCLKFIKSKDVYLESIGPEDIVNGNKRLILGLIWTIILRFQLSLHLDFVQFDLKSIKDSLLLWCQSKTSKSPNCRVRDFKRSWSDGWAFVELVRSFRPDLIDPAAISKCTSVQMLDKAFNLANQHLMIPPLLDAEDVATSADENSILTYISYFYNLYCRNKTTGTGSKRIKFIITQLSEVHSVQNSYEAQVSELLVWIKERTVHLESDIDINEASEHMSQFNDYFWTVRPEKLRARNDAESLYLDIVNMHKKRGLKKFVPKANLTVKDLEKAWQHLEEVETRRQSQLKEKIVKYEQLTKVMDAFDLKCIKLENYISEKLVLLNQIYQWKSTEPDDQNTDLSSLEVHLKQSELICCDIVSNSAKFDSIAKLADQLIEHRYKNFEFVEMCRRHLKAKLKNLTDMAAQNRRIIEATTQTIHYLKQLDCLKVELEQLTAGLTSLPQNPTNSVQNVFSNLEKCKQYETELRLLERQFLVVQSRLFLLTDNNNHNHHHHLQSSVLIEPTIFQQRLSLIRSSLDQCRRLLEQHIRFNHQTLDYNEFSEEIEYLQMFFSEKTLLCQSSLDVCFDSTSIYPLQQRHNIIKLEVKTAEKQFLATCKKGYRLIAKDANYYSRLVNESIEQTKQSLRRLVHLVNERTYLINDSIQLMRLVDQLGALHRLPKLEDIHQTVTSCLREASEVGRLELAELSELLERINGLSVSAEHLEKHHGALFTSSSSSSSAIHLVHLKEYSQAAVVIDHRHAFLVLRLEQSVHRLPHDIHCRLLRVVTDNFRAAQQLFTATAVDVNGDSLRRWLLLLPLEQRRKEADSAGASADGNEENTFRQGDDEEELLSLQSTSAAGHLNLPATERLVDLFLSGDNRLEHFIGSLQERQAMVQSDMASMNELMAFVRHTLQLLKVTTKFTRTFVQVKTDQQHHRRQFHNLRQSQTSRSSIVAAGDPSDDKTTSIPPFLPPPPPPQLPSPYYQSKLNPEAFKFKIVTYKLQQNLNFIGNYLGYTVNDDNATALAFKLNFSCDLIQKDLAQLRQLLTAEESLPRSLELRQEAEKTVALIDSVMQNQTMMGGKVATLQRLEAVENFFQTMADSVKQIGQIRADADQVTVRRHVRQMKTVTVTLQSHFEELIDGASSFADQCPVHYNDVKLYENRITSLKRRFTHFQQVISQKSELCRQRLEQLSPSEIQISPIKAIIQQTIETSYLSRVRDQQLLDSKAIVSKTNQAPSRERKSNPEQTQKDTLENQLNIAELVLFEMESAAGSVSQGKFAETMAICDIDFLLDNNPLIANDDTLKQRVENLKRQLTRAWNNQVRQNELKQFNLLSAEFMTSCNQRIELLKSLQSCDRQEIANCKQMVVQLQLDQRAIYEQFHLSKSEEIISRLVQLHDTLAKYEQIVNEKEVVAEAMAQLDDITKRFDSVKLTDNISMLEDLLAEIDAAINVSNEHQLLLTRISMKLKKQIIERQMKIKLNTVVKKMSGLTEPDQVKICSILKSTFENLIASSEQLSVDNFNHDNKINDLLLNWSLIKDKVDRISELIGNTSAQADATMTATNISPDHQSVFPHFSLNNNSSLNQSIHQQPEAISAEIYDNQSPSSTPPIISPVESPWPLTSSTTMTLPPKLIKDIQPKTFDDHMTSETMPAELISPDIEMSTEFDTKTSGRVGTRSSLESDFSADYLLSVKDFGSMQTSSDENFAHNLTESTLSLYYSESDSGHCELNYNNMNSPERRGDHQAGACTECQQSTDNKHQPLAIGASLQTISSSYASLPISAMEYLGEGSDELKCEPECEHSQPEPEPEPEQPKSDDHQIEKSYQSAEQMCTEMWTTVESAFEKVNQLVVRGNYSADQQTQQLLAEISLAITNRQQNEQEKFLNVNDNTQEGSNRVLQTVLHTLSQSNRQLKYLVDHDLQYLTELSSKIQSNEPTDELIADELDDHADGKAAPLAEQEDSCCLPAEEVNLTQHYTLSKSHPIDFTSTDFDSYGYRGESSLSFASDIESNLHVDESIQPQLEGLEEKVDGIKSELEDIAARIAKHSDGKRLLFEVGNLDEMFEFKPEPETPVSLRENVINESDSIDGTKFENSSTQSDNENCLNDKSNSETLIPCQLEKLLEDHNDQQDLLQLCSKNASTEMGKSQTPDYSNLGHSSDDNSNSTGGKHPTRQEEEFIVGDEKMTSVVDFDELTDDENADYLEKRQDSYDANEKTNFTAKTSLHKNDETKADFPIISLNRTDSSTVTANTETQNLLSPFVVNQQSTSSISKIDEQQREPIDDVQLDCLEDKVQQIATQLDAIAEKLAEHVQLKAVDKNTSNASEVDLQNGVPPVTENVSPLNKSKNLPHADNPSTNHLKIFKETSANYTKSKTIEIHQTHSTSIITTSDIEFCQSLTCQSSSSVSLPVINTEVTYASTDENETDKTKDSETDISNILTSVISFPNNANQSSSYRPAELFDQINDYSTVPQKFHSNLSLFADVSRQTKSIKQTDEYESNVWHLTEESRRSEHLKKLSHSVNVGNQSTVDNCCQRAELNLSAGDSSQFIEDHNVNSVVQSGQIEPPPTKQLLFNLLNTSTSISRSERNDLTEAENLEHDCLLLNDNVAQIENIDSRLGCLEDRICNIASQLDALAAQLIALMPTSQTFENLDPLKNIFNAPDKLLQNSKQAENIFLTTIKQTNGVTSNIDFENDKNLRSKNENNEEQVNSANKMPGDELPENDQLPESKDHNIFATENVLPDTKKAFSEDDFEQNNFEMTSDETIGTSCPNDETENRSYQMDLISTENSNEISNTYNYSLSKSHHVNFKFLNTNLKKCDLSTDFEPQRDPVTADNYEWANEIGHSAVDSQAKSVTVPIPDDLQMMNIEPNANETQPPPESTIQNGLFLDDIKKSNNTFVAEQLDILQSNNLTVAKNIDSEQQLPANCKIEEAAPDIDLPRNELQNNKATATSQKLNSPPAIEKQSLTINSENESYEIIDERQIDSLENRISIIADKLDDIAKNLINIAEFQTLTTGKTSKTNKLNERNENTFSEKTVSEKWKFEQQTVLSNSSQPYCANSIDANEISQQFEHFDLNEEVLSDLKKYISHFHSNFTTQAPSELSKVQTTSPLVQQPGMQTYASSSTVKIDCVTAAVSVEQQSSPASELRQSGSSNEQIETRIQHNDESSMQESYAVVNDKQLMNDNNENTHSCGQTDPNYSATAERQAECSTSESETPSGQITNETHHFVPSKTVTTSENRLATDHFNEATEADMKDSSDFTEQTTTEAGHSNNLKTYADAVKQSNADCKVPPEKRDSQNASNLSIQTSTSRKSTDKLLNSPISSEHYESSSTDMNRVTCDDDAILDYIETRVDVLDSKISHLTEWFNDYCSASRRPEQSEHLIWPKLDVLTIEPASESFEQINSAQSMTLDKNDDSSVQLISGNSINGNNSSSNDSLNNPKDDRIVNTGYAFQQNTVYLADLPADQEDQEHLHRLHDARSTCKVLDDKLDKQIYIDFDSATNDESVPLTTKLDSSTETYELNHFASSILLSNELQPNALPPNSLSEKSNELELINHSKQQQTARETKGSVEKHVQTVIQSPELESLRHQSSQVHNTQVYDSSSVSTEQNRGFVKLQVDKSSEKEQGEGEISTNALCTKSCHTSQDFKDDSNRKPRSVSDFNQPWLASIRQRDILPGMSPIDDKAMDGQQPDDAPQMLAVENIPSEPTKDILLIDLTSDFPYGNDSLTESSNKSTPLDGNLIDGDEEQPLDARQPRAGDTDTGDNLSLVPANDRADIDQAEVVVPPKSPISDSQQPQSSDNVKSELSESQHPVSSPMKIGSSRPPSENFISRNIGRVARYSIPCYLLPLLILLILLIFPHGESDFNCLLQFDEYRSGIMKTFQDGPPPV